MNPWAVILAAGAGVRFGGDKLLADLDGRPLVSRPLDLAKHAIGEGLLAGAVAVTPGDDSGMATLARGHGIRSVPNPDRDRGISSSIRTGLAALPSDADAALFLLGDEPFVPVEAIRTVLDRWSATGAPFIRAASMGVPCHPVLVARSLWPRARELRGDTGFRVLSGLIPVLVPMEFPAPHHDVDTPDDLARARSFRA